MRPTLLFILCIFQQLTFCQIINALRTDKDVVAFYKKHFSQLQHLELNKIFTSKKNLRYVDSLKVKPWYKEDFNNDGEDDLLLTGRVRTEDGIEDKAYVILSNISSIKYQLIDLILKDRKSIMPIVKVVKINKVPLIIFQQAEDYEFDKKYLHLVKVPISYQTYGLTIQWLDTLIFYNSGFINYNAAPNKRSIQFINYKSLPCFGSCSFFELHVDSVGHAELNALSNNDKLEGRYSTKLSSENLQTLIWLINYLNVSALDTNYSVGWTDDATAILEVKFDDGTVKRIRDYGKTGTHGLIALYKFIGKLRYVENWEKQDSH